MSARDDQRDLFASPDIRGMVRRFDHASSVDAAEALAPGRSRLQMRVLLEFYAVGAMTDAELESRECFGGFGFSTIRKRRSELFQQGLLEETGKRRKFRDGRVPLKIWRISTKGRREILEAMGELARVPSEAGSGAQGPG